MIAILGTGLLGAGFTRAARRRGEEVRVWNRTHERARPLADVGAQVCETAAEAVRGATRVHVVVADDAAVDAVLAAARPGLAPGTLIVDHTTTSTAGARARTAAWPREGQVYLHAPVFMGPQNANDATGVMMVSGDRTTVERAKPLLAPMTGKLVDLGERVDAAAAFKLCGNMFLMAMTSGLAEMLALAGAMGVGAKEIAGLFDHFNPGTTVGMRLGRMTEAQFEPPSWELAMARKDARLIAAEAEGAGVSLALVPAIAAWMDVALKAGDAHLDWTVI
ncbi:MAG TPA: NAD(P)-binding domain-containing protein, partial [Kofleriaceae bacterium]|nr:NAD(P)-binding domain-containing protein [Kofleriaceae bacterium]